MLNDEAFEFGHLLLAIQLLPVRGMLRDIVQFFKQTDLKLLDEDWALIAGVVSSLRSRLFFYFKLHLTFFALMCCIFFVFFPLSHHSLSPVLKKLILVAHQMLMKIFDPLTSSGHELIGSFVVLIASLYVLSLESKVQID